MHGGKRAGSGRKQGSRLDRAIKDVSQKVLADVRQEVVWKELVQHEDAKVRLEAMKYLSNRAFGMPKQSVEQSGPDGGPIVNSIRVEYVDPEHTDS